MIFDGDVYLAKSENGFYKIGISKDPEKRIKHFQTIMPMAIEIVHTFPSDNCREAEKRLHHYYRTSRVTGEWFSLNDFDVDMVCNTTTFFEGEFHHIKGYVETAIDDTIESMVGRGILAWVKDYLPY